MAISESMANGLPKPPGRIYDEFASWWQLLSPREDYAGEAAFYQRALLEACRIEPRTMLELGSGGGNNASYLKERFAMTLVDLSPAMHAQSRAINPDCEHVLGDMRDVRLDRHFDCVFVHDAICYITTESDLKRVLDTAFVHCKPGGAVLLVPDFTRETFRPGTSHDGRDDGVRGMRFLEWAWDPDPTDTIYTVDYACMFRDGDGSMHVEHDRHVEGLFPRQVWLQLLADAGFAAERLDQPDDPSGISADVFVGKKPLK